MKSLTLTKLVQYFSCSKNDSKIEITKIEITLEPSLSAHSFGLKKLADWAGFSLLANYQGCKIVWVITIGTHPKLAE